MLAVPVALTPAGGVLANDGLIPPSSLTTVPPCRMVDTRSTIGALGPGESLVALVRGRCGVPRDALAITGTLTAVDTAGAGHLAIAPTNYGSDGTLPKRWTIDPPGTSSVNYRAGTSQANGFTTALGRTGSVQVFTSAPTQVLIDVTGYFTKAPSGARTGRFVPINPRRVLDTRTTGVSVGSTPTILDLSILDVEADAFALSIVSVDNAAAGHVRIWPANTPMPNASVINFTEPRETRAGSVFVGHRQGQVALYSPTEVHVVIDVTGYFTSASAPVSSDGLFVATTPSRLVDTRAGGTLSTGGTMRLATERYAAGLFNITMVNAVQPNYLTIWPAGHNRPLASIVNAIPGNNAAANMAVAGVTVYGLSIYSLQRSDVIVDQFGYFLGQPIERQRRMFLVSDSAIAGLRWTGNVGRLTNADWWPYLESCRRLVYPSCHGREGYTPITAVEEIAGFPDDIRSDDVLVMATGYNDWESRFEGDLATIMNAARRKGFEHVVWLTYRADNSYQLHDAPQVVANYRAMNTTLYQQRASGNWPELSLWDYDDFSKGQPTWFSGDGIHLTTTGAREVADWLSAQAAGFEP